MEIFIDIVYSSALLIYCVALLVVNCNYIVADDKYDSCDVPQQQFDQREHDENYVFTTYTEGSIVWARVDGFPW